MMKSLIMLLLALLLASAVQAHGFGNTQTVVQGNRTFEFGMTNLAPKAGERVGLSFSVDENGTPVSGETASIRISQGNDIYFISNGFMLSNETVLAMSFIFPKAGTYDVDISVGAQRATFPVVVSDTSQFSSILAIIAALLIGAALGYLIRAKVS